MLVATVNPTFVANENATVLACCFVRSRAAVVMKSPRMERGKDVRMGDQDVAEALSRAGRSAFPRRANRAGCCAPGVGVRGRIHPAGPRNARTIYRCRTNLSRNSLPIHAKSSMIAWMARVRRPAAWAAGGRARLAGSTVATRRRCKAGRLPERGQDEAGSVRESSQFPASSCCPGRHRVRCLDPAALTGPLQRIRRPVRLRHAVRTGRNRPTDRERGGTAKGERRRGSQDLGPGRGHAGCGPCTDRGGGPAGSSPGLNRVAAPPGGHAGSRAHPRSCLPLRARPEFPDPSSRSMSGQRDDSAPVP